MKNQTEPLEDKQPMNIKQMDNLLVDLYQTKYWEALRKFIDIEMLKAENALCSLDLAKNLSEASRCQGIRMGLYSIVQYIENEIERRKKEDSKNEEEENDKNGNSDIPNYNYY